MGSPIKGEGSARSFNNCSPVPQRPGTDSEDLAPNASPVGSIPSACFQCDPVGLADCVLPDHGQHSGVGRRRGSCSAPGLLFARYRAYDQRLRLAAFWLALLKLSLVTLSLRDTFLRDVDVGVM